MRKYKLSPERAGENDLQLGERKRKKKLKKKSSASKAGLGIHGDRISRKGRNM